MGPKLARAVINQAELFRLVLEDQDHIARRLHPNPYYEAHELHAFAPRVHVGGGKFRVGDGVDEDLCAGLRSVEVMMIRNATMAEAFNVKLKLPPAFPSAPFGPKSKYGFYVRHGDERLCFYNFHSAYAARHFLDIVMGDEKPRWLNDDEILIESRGIRIKSEGAGDLDAVIEKKLTATEREWLPPEPYHSQWRRVAGIIKTPLPDEVKAKPAKTKKERAPSQPRAPRADNLVSIADIAAQLNKEPRDCRKALRDAKVEKPECGWAWPPDAAAKIKDIVQKHVR